MLHVPPLLRRTFNADPLAPQAAAQLLGTAQSTFQLDGAFDPAPAPAPPADSLDALLCAPVEPELKLRNSTCVLTPVVTQGPYYHDAGHPVRQNMAEDQLGLPFVMDVGVIDVHTCEPMEGVLIDVWHANSTGRECVPACLFLWRVGC